MGLSVWRLQSLVVPFYQLGRRSILRGVGGVFVGGVKNRLLLKQVRDEAHRFAITYNRKVRTKRTIKSALDDIPGIGPAKRTALLKHFGSLKRIKKASIEELMQVKGISKGLAERVNRV